MKRLILIISIFTITLLLAWDKLTYKETFLNVSFISEQEVNEMILSDKLTASSIYNKVKFEESYLVEDSVRNDYYITVGKEYTGNFQINKGIDYYWIEDSEKIYDKIKNNEALKLYTNLNNEYQIIDIKVSTLPLVSISSEEVPTIKDGVYYKGEIKLYEANHIDYKRYTESSYDMQYKVRGGTSWLYEKQPYKMELLKSDGSKKSEALLGLRSDDDWNLTPNYTDHSLIREAVSISLFHQVNEIFDEPVTHQQNLVFCELFMNGAYHGVYELIEPMDEKQVELNRETDYLYKMHDWGQPTTYSLLEQNDLPEDNLSIAVDSYPEGYENERYTPYVDFLNASTTTFEEFEHVIDVDNHIVNAIMKMVLSAEDNDIKNMFYVLEPNGDGTFKSRKEYYDLNATLGEKWDESAISPDKIMHSKYSVVNDLTYAKRFFEIYDELRLKALSTENIIDTITEYYEIVTSSGAILRNHKRWKIDGVPEEEYDKIVEFMVEHMKYVDEYIEQIRNEVNSLSKE